MALNCGTPKRSRCRHLMSRILYLLWGTVLLGAMLLLKEPFGWGVCPVGLSPAYAQETLKVYIPDPVTDTVAVFNLMTHRVIKRIPLGAKVGGPRDDPRGVTMSPDGHYAYLTNHHSGTVAVINTTKDEVIQRIALSLPDLGNIAIAPDGSTLYIPHYSAKAVTILKIPENVQRVIRLEGFPGDVAVTRNGRTVLVTSRDSRTLLALDVSTDRVSSIEVGRNPVGVAVTPDGQEAYVSHDNARVVFVVDLTTSPFKVKGRIDVGMTGGSAVAVTPDGRHVFVAHCCANSAVSVIAIQTKTVACLLPLAPRGLDPVRIIFTPDGSEAFVINSQSRNISTIRPPCGTPTTENPFG